MSRSPTEFPCRQKASERDDGDRSGAPSTPYQLTSSRQNVVRQTDGCALRKAIMALKNRRTSWLVSVSVQSSQVTSESTLYGFLSPRWVCMNSSPIRNMGVPLDI